MFKYNSDHIFTGQIKQILNTFNLPSYKVYTKKHAIYYNDTGKEHPSIIDGLYIKNGKVVRYKDGTWSKELGIYGYNKKVVNITKNLKIANNIYDTYTHEYLGDFLRFQRDYLGIDLMPLYNCFGKRVCSHIDIPINKLVKQEKDKNGNLVDIFERQRHIFWSKDPDYTIYAVPIKFFQKYTIAIDCSCGVEMCCGFYNDYLDVLPENYEELNYYKAWNLDQTSYETKLLPRLDLSQLVSDNTYKKYSELRFNAPFVWNGLTEEVFNKLLSKCVQGELTPILPEDTIEQQEIKRARLDKAGAYRQQFIRKENDLKLFIKIPIYNQSSITILEGDYSEFNHFIYRPVQKEIHQTSWVENDNGEAEQETKIIKKIVWERKQNKFITNYETSLLGEGATPEQVVAVTNPEVEERDFIPISPLQLLMYNTGESYPFADRLMEYLSGNVITDFDTNTDNIKRIQKVMELNENHTEFPGMWEGKMRNILYDYMMQGKPTSEQFPREIAHDILGYVDKDVEKYYTAWKHELCKDKDGNFIPLTEKVYLYDEETGKPIFDPETGKHKYKEEQLYREVNLPLAEKDKKLLLETRSFLLMIQDIANLPMYKEVYKPVCTLSNVDIYDEEE